METVAIPAHLVDPMPEFGDAFRVRVDEGAARLRSSKVVFVGLARNCAPYLAGNLARLELLASGCGEWALHVESNDCEDDTLGVLHAFAARHPQATFHYQVLGRRQYTTEFAGRRTIAMAEYRDACQRWVRACHPDADYVVVVDWDQWGGWSHAGVLNGIGWLVELQAAYGMASVSLMQHPTLSQTGDGVAELRAAWLHYDAWALRLNSYWDDYTHGQGGWKHQWLPPVGSDPVHVRSAFGGLCIYRTGAYLAGTYDGASDCEHVPYHASIARKTGQFLYLNPSQRCVMHWLTEAANAGHGLDSVQDVPGDAA